MFCRLLYCSSFELRIAVLWIRNFLIRFWILPYFSARWRKLNYKQNSSINLRDFLKPSCEFFLLVVKWTVASEYGNQQISCYFSHRKFELGGSGFEINNSGRIRQIISVPTGSGSTTLEYIYSSAYMYLGTSGM